MLSYGIHVTLDDDYYTGLCQLKRGINLEGLVVGRLTGRSETWKSKEVMTNAFWVE